MIEIKNAGKTYKSKIEEKIALKDINLTFENQGFVVITGESGSGKTTLMNCISGLDFFSEGSITGITKSDVAFVFQDYQLIEDLSIRDNFVIGLKVSDKDIQDALNKVKLDDIPLNKKICHLSGGQKQRLSIARALLLNRRVIVCDEPTGNLDKNTSLQIVNLLYEISRGRLVIAVTHNVNLFKEYADELINLKDGCIDSIIGNTNEIEEKELPPTQIHLSWKRAISISLKRIGRYWGRYSINCILLALSFLVFITSILFVANDGYKVYGSYFEYFQIDRIDYFYERRMDDFSLDPNKIDWSKSTIDKLLKNKDFGGEENILLAYRPTKELSSIYYNNKYTPLSNIYITDYFSLDTSFLLDYKAIAISEILAKKIFGSEEAIGKIVFINSAPCVISRIINDNPARFNKIINSKQFPETLSSYIYCSEATFAYLSSYGILSKESRMYKNILGNSCFYKDNENQLKENEIILPRMSLENHIDYPKEPEYYLGKELNIPIDISGKVVIMPFQLKSFGKEVILSKERYMEIGIGEYDAYSLAKGKYGVSYNTLPLKEKCLELEGKGYVMTSYLSEELKATLSYVEARGKTLIFTCIGAIIVLAIFNIFLVQGAMESKQREVGILASMNFKMKSIFKLFIFESVFPLFISAIMALSFVPLILYNFNYKTKALKIPFLYFNFLHIFIVFGFIIIMLGIYFLILFNRFRKKTNIELVYEK